MKTLAYDPETDRRYCAEAPIPAPGEHDVLVRVHACGLNPVDAKITRWKTRSPGMRRGWVGGLDVSGEIVEVGPSVTAWLPGDRVLTHGDMFRPHGGLAEFSIQDSRTLVRHPATSAVEAAATPCAGWTAWRALHDRLRITARDTLLIAGGSGGVGGYAIQIARHAGVKTIIATCSAQNAGYVRSLGATHAIDYAAERVPDAVRAITHGEGVTRALDTAGGDTAADVANSLAFEGEMVELVDVVEPRRYDEAFMKGLGFHQLSLGSGHRHGEAARATLTRTGAAFGKALERGDITTPVLRVVGFDLAADALADLLDRRTVGKIVFTP